MVFLGFVTPWRRARSPTSRSPVLLVATTDGVVRAPSAFSSICGSPPAITAIAELVVPKSIPSIFAIHFLLITNKIFLNILLDSNLSVALPHAAELKGDALRVVSCVKASPCRQILQLKPGLAELFCPPVCILPSEHSLLYGPEIHLQPFLLAKLREGCDRHPGLFLPR